MAACEVENRALLFRIFQSGVLSGAFLPKVKTGFLVDFSRFTH